MKYVYMVLSRNELPDNYSSLKNPQSDVLVSSWKPRHAESDWFDLHYHLGTTWGEARNELLKIAVDADDYDYFIFMDDDIQTDLVRHIPFLQNFLEDKRPCVAYPRIGWLSSNGQPVQLKYNCDAGFSVFRKDTLFPLLPYYNAFQSESWYYSQAIVNIMQTAFCNLERIQMNEIPYENGKSAVYPRGKNWDRVVREVTGWLREDYRHLVQKMDCIDIPETLLAPKFGSVSSEELDIDRVLVHGTDYYVDKMQFWQDRRKGSR